MWPPVSVSGVTSGVTPISGVVASGVIPVSGVVAKFVASVSGAAALDVAPVSGEAFSGGIQVSIRPIQIRYLDCRYQNQAAKPKTKNQKPKTKNKNRQAGRQAGR